MATLTGVVTPPVLLGLMFVFGIGFGFTGPASKAVIDDLVPTAQLAAAHTAAAGTAGETSAKPAPPA